MMKDWMPRLVLFVADSISLTLAGFLGYYLRTSSFFVADPYIKNPGQYLLLLVAALIIWQLIAFVGNAYSPRPAIFKIDELLFHFKASILLLFVLMSLTFLYKSYDYSRLILFFSWFFMVILGNLFRQLACRLRSWLYKKELGVRQAVLWGKSENMDFLKSRISANSGSGLFIIENAENKSLLSLVSEVAIDELFVVAEDINYEEIWQLREASANPGMRLHLVPSLGKMYLRNLQGLFFDGTVLVSLGSMRDKRMHLFAKRIFDLAIALPALIVFSPLFLLLALLVKLDSAGSVLFAQKRVGLNERQFTMYKFRTMFKDANAYAETPRDKADDRITRVGRFLRSTGLDELPQLFNVLGGSMSIVGPRPEMPFIVEKYSELERQRLQAKPGITGLWQVYARCENLPIHHHIEYDLYYIENFSLVLDVIIILDTIPTAFLHTGI